MTAVERGRRAASSCIRSFAETKVPMRYRSAICSGVNSKSESGNSAVAAQPTASCVCTWTMSFILGILLLASTAFAQDLKRPSVDTGSNSAMPKAYDSAGLTTSSQLAQGGSLNCNQFGCTGVSITACRVFKSWALPSVPYSTLTLNFNSSADNNPNAVAASSGVISYSIDNGMTWTPAQTDSGSGWTEQTTTVTLSAGQNLARLQVRACAGGAGDGSSKTVSAEVITVFDIWTLGNGGNSNSGAGSSAGARHNGVVVN